MFVNLAEVIVPEVPWYIQGGGWFLAGVLVCLAIVVPFCCALSAIDNTSARSLLITAAISAVVLIPAAVISIVHYNSEKAQWYEEAASVFEESVVTPYQLKRMNLIGMVTSSTIEIEAFPQDWIVHPTTGEYVKDYRVIITDGRVVAVSGDEGGVLKQQIAEGK